MKHLANAYRGESSFRTSFVQARTAAIVGILASISVLSSAQGQKVAPPGYQILTIVAGTWYQHCFHAKGESMMRFKAVVELPVPLGFSNVENLRSCIGGPVRGNPELFRSNALYCLRSLGIPHQASDVVAESQIARKCGE